MKKKERRMLHKEGVEYLQKTGLDLIVWTSFGKTTLQPGLAFENIEKEKLTTPYSIKLNNGIIYTLNKNLQKRYQITTEVDLQRVLRICSILVTNFNGLEEKDSSTKHREGIRQWIKDQSNGIDRIGFHMVMALHTLDEILGYKKHFDFSENFSFVNILRILYKLWLNDPLEEFSIPKDLPKI